VAADVAATPKEQFAGKTKQEPPIDLDPWAKLFYVVVVANWKIPPKLPP